MILIIALGLLNINCSITKGMHTPYLAAGGALTACGLVLTYFSHSFASISLKIDEYNKMPIIIPVGLGYLLVFSGYILIAAAIYQPHAKTNWLSQSILGIFICCIYCYTAKSCPGIQ